MRSHFWDRIVAQCYQFFINFSLSLLCALIFIFFLSSFSLSLVLFITCHRQSRALRHMPPPILCSLSTPFLFTVTCALRPLLLTLSFIFSPPLYFPFSLNLEFVGLGCGRDAMLGVVGLWCFFMDRGRSLWWFGEWVLRFDIGEF